MQIDQPAAKTIVGEAGFEGNLARLGNGFQRSYLLALLEVLATSGRSEKLPKLILACEEPELYQHPPQERHLASVLEELSANTAQVLVSTHSPAFVTGRGFESVRLVRFEPAALTAKSKQLKFEQVAERLAEVTDEKHLKASGIEAKLHQVLQPNLNEMFFAKNLVLVEGLEDAAVISSWMFLTDRWNTFRRKGIHIVQVEGKSRLAHPLIIAEGMGIPVFTIFDADRNIDEKYKSKHKQDNELLLKLLGANSLDPFPVDTVWGDKYVIWPHNITELINAEIPAEKLAGFEMQANTLYGNGGGLQKNGLQIGAKLRLAFQDGVRLPSLEKLCDAILDTAK